MTRHAVFAAAFALLAAPAAASSGDAWAEHEQEVTEACVAASGLKNARPLSQLAMFDDSVGYDGLLITGEYPQEHMKGQTAMTLCLYNKADGKAFVSELTDK